MKYCFFDIDGVLNTSNQWKHLYSLNEKCIHEFCHFVKANNLTPVMTSSWRTGFVSTLNPDNLPHVKQLEQLFQQYNVTIADKTPVLNGRSRDKEIQRFLYFHPCDNYMIIDDDSSEYDVLTNKNYFVDAQIGFTNADARTLKRLI